MFSAISTFLWTSHYPLTFSRPRGCKSAFWSHSRGLSQNIAVSCFSDIEDIIFGSIRVVSVISIMHCKIVRWHFENSTGLAGGKAGPDLSFIIYKHLTFWHESCSLIFLSVSFLCNLEMVMAVLTAFHSRNENREQRKYVKVLWKLYSISMDDFF